MKKFHTVVIGGGSLGSASAISLARYLKKHHGNPESICLIEKNVLGSGISAKQSGIVRSANADKDAAKLAKISTDMWLNIEKYWGVGLNIEKTGAIWIAKKDKNDSNPKWEQISKNLEKVPIIFERIKTSQAQNLCPDYINLYDDEIFYYEPNAIQIDPAESRQTLYQGVLKSNLTLLEGEEVISFKKSKSDKISEVVLSKQTLQADYIINAAGAWSPKLFAKIGVSIPVSVEPVFVVNWLNTLNLKQKKMPIIADYVNRAYFRSWREGEIHMHQPRKRDIQETASSFSDNPLGIIGADFLNDPLNQMQGYSHVRLYEEIANKRFNNLKHTVFSSGYKTYFDITPDLKFILGPDKKIKNLIHCIGSGQAFKYSPVFGEMMTEYIFQQKKLAELGNNFSISRFDKKYMNKFWKNTQGINYSLKQENNIL